MYKPRAGRNPDGTYKCSQKTRTRQFSVAARKRGDLIPRPCEICGYEPAECHHIDYSDPERVMWLCKKHHEQTHSQFGRPAPLDWIGDIRAAVKRIDAQRLEARRSRAAPSSD